MVVHGQDDVPVAVGLLEPVDLTLVEGHTPE